MDDDMVLQRNSLYFSALGASYRPLENRSLTALWIHMKVSSKPKQTEVYLLIEVNGCDAKS